MMMKLHCTLIIAIVLMGVTGCSSNTQTREEAYWDYQSGYVVAKEDGKVLVVRDKIVSTQTSLSEILKLAEPNAVWITLIDDSIYGIVKIGDAVEINSPGEKIIDMSFPAQMTANIKIK